MKSEEDPDKNFEENQESRDALGPPKELLLLSSLQQMNYP